MANYTHLKSGTGAFSEMMLNNKFGVVTVMNARVYDYTTLKNANAFAPVDATKERLEFEPGIIDTEGNWTIGGSETPIKPICRLDTLKVANVTIEGPTKTVTGGQYSNPLIKFGKTARLEMQDALGDSNVIEALCGGLNEWELATTHSAVQDGELSDSEFPKIETATDKENYGLATLHALHYGADFSGPKTIVGDSYFIDRVSGKQVPVTIIFYQFLGDSIFNLTQDAEGDATVFDMNGDLAMTEVNMGDNTGKVIGHDVFYSVFARLPEKAAA